MKKHLLKAVTGMILASLLIITTGCETDNSVNFTAPVIRVVGTAHGVVTDAYNNARLEGVQVTVVQRDKIYQTETDELGYYIVDKLYSGSYEVTFHLDGYALSRAYGYIPTQEEIYDTKDNINYTEVIDHDMYGFTAGLTGKVYKIIDDQVHPAAGVTVYADFSDFDLHPDKYSVTTNSDGVYVFSGLPATPEVRVITLPHNDGTYSFDMTVNEGGLIPNGTVTAPDIGIFITDAPVFVLTHNMQDGFPIDGQIIMNFNKAIDPESFNLWLGRAKVEIHDVVWTNDNTTVTITPDEDLLLDTWYELWFEGKSVDGNYFENDYWFITQPGIEILRTSFQPYDGYNEIPTVNTAMRIYFSEPVNTSHTDRSYRIDGVSVSPSWSDGNRTLEISIPSDFPIDYESGDNFMLSIRVYSTLTDYDQLTENWRVNIK